jgi:hypothetical protein
LILIASVGPRPTLATVTTTDGERFIGLPGWELVSRGLEDQAAGLVTIESLLIASASTRVERLGLPVSHSSGSVDWRLYQLIEDEIGEAGAHSRYNALRRRLLSFLRSADATQAS